MSKSETQISKEKAGAVASRSKFVLKTLDFEPSFIDVISWIVQISKRGTVKTALSICVEAVHRAKAR
jgi:hypothetical protein